MKTRIQNQLNMVAAVLAVLEKPEFKPVWENRDPTVFTKKVRILHQANAAALKLGKDQTQSTKGTAAEKAGIETQLEDLLIEEAGLLVSYYEDHEDAVNLAKADIAEGTIRNLPNQELLSLAATIGELAGDLAENHAAAAAEYGITPASVEKVRAATENFEGHIGQPIGVRAIRKQTTADLERNAGKLLKLLLNMDKFIPRFRAGAEGAVFAGAWRHARQVVRLGHRFEKTSFSPGPEAAPAVQ